MSSELTDLFDQLYRDNQARVYRLALGLTGKPGDAEDITQEAFLRAFRSYHSFRGESSFLTWIYRITLNVASNYLKQRKQLPIYVLTKDLGYPIEEIFDLNPSNNPETELLAREARIRCLHCFTECLPANQRKVFCLAYNIGLPHKHIAEIMECSVGTVKTTLCRARKRVAGYLENTCQLIKKSNPCHCSQWVRYGLQQGWIKKEQLLNPRPEIMIQAEGEIVKLQTLRNIYQSFYRKTADEFLAQRIKTGIKNNEWAILS
jgi:RNA polymerase sigma-70 factor (ECF subfamily)